MYPQEPGKGYEFENKIVGGVVPKEYIPSVDKGIQEALNSGVLAGYPVEDVRVELVDGSYHEVDSSEAAFKVAGSMAIKDALKKSNPVILEPVMNVEVETPEEYTGSVSYTHLDVYKRQAMSFAVNDTVDHKVFGRGTVVKVDGDTLHVKFARNNQTKKLLKDYAPIVKIS